MNFFRKITITLFHDCLVSSGTIAHTSQIRVFAMLSLIFVGNQKSSKRPHTYNLAFPLLSSILQNHISNF
jgi:hypothetical protein